MAPLALCVRGAGGSTLSGRTTQLNGLKRAFSRVTCQGWGGSVRHGAVHGSEHRLGYSNDDCAEGARVFFTEAMNLPNQAPDRLSSSTIRSLLVFAKCLLWPLVTGP